MNCEGIEMDAVNVVLPMKIAKYLPSFVDDDDFDDYLTEVNSLNELFALEWVDKWTKDSNFKRWSIVKSRLNAVMGGPFQFKGQDHHYLVAYAYFTDDRPYIVEENGRPLPNLNDLPKE